MLNGEEEGIPADEPGLEDDLVAEGMLRVVCEEDDEEEGLLLLLLGLVRLGSTETTPSMRS